MQYQTRSDHSNKVVSPPRGLPVDMHQLTPARETPVFNEVQQQTTSICVTICRLPNLGSRCTQHALGGSGPLCLPTSSHSGQSSGGTKGQAM